MRCVVAALSVLALCAPAWADVHVTISKSQQQMAVSIDGGPSYRWAVSTGKPGYDTPGGSFRAIRLEQVYYSKKYDDAPMPNAVFFHGGYAIHGTLEERRLGQPVSHGCVRLMRANAALLFEAVRAQGMSRTHIVITDAPLYGGMPMAGYDGRFGGSRGYDDRGAQRGNYGYEGGVTRGFVVLDDRGYRGGDGYSPDYVTFDDQRRGVARGYDDRGYDNSRGARIDDRGFERGREVTRSRYDDQRRTWREPSFVDFSKRSYRDQPPRRESSRHESSRRESSRQVSNREPRYRDERYDDRRNTQPRNPMRLEPGRRYTEAEVRRIYRDNGWER
jgi:hypothetical protein